MGFYCKVFKKLEILNSRVVIKMETEKSGLDTKMNLCDSCENDIATCIVVPETIQYGDGLGGDNIIKCPVYVKDSWH